MVALYVYAQMAFSALERRFEDKSKGATAVEYGIMVAAIAIVIIGIVITLGGQLNTVFTKVSTEIGTLIK